MRYLILTTALASLISASAFAGACPANPKTVTCNIASSLNGEKLAIQLVNGGYYVGADNWPGGQNKSGAGSSQFVLSTKDYDVEHIECDIDLIGATQDTGTKVSIDCDTGTGTYSHFEEQNAIEDGSPCGSQKGNLSGCKFE